MMMYNLYQVKCVFDNENFTQRYYSAASYKTSLNL